MKIRNGFVSNSSTSSFVIIGYEISKEKKALSIVKELNNGLGVNDKIKNEYFEDDAFTYYLKGHLKIKDIIFRVGNGENECETGEVLIGISLADVSSDNGSHSEAFCLEDFSAKLEKIKETFSIISAKLTLYTGVRMS